VQTLPAIAALILSVSASDGGAAAEGGSKPSSWGMPDREHLVNLIGNAAVAAVMMTTLVVSPFYLKGALALTDLQIGMAMSVGPAISIVSGTASGHIVDAWGSRRALTAGLILLICGAAFLAVLPGLMGITGYVLAIVVLTPGYQLFQAANNTAMLLDAKPERRGTVSGYLNLSRNMGLMAGATAMSTVFAIGVGTSDLLTAPALQLDAGMRLVFAASCGLLICMMGLILLVRSGYVGKAES